MAELTESKLNPDENSSPVSNDEEKPCFDVINEAVAAEAGIVRVRLDPQQQQITFDYNPDVIAGPAVDQIAQRIAPPLQHNLETSIYFHQRRHHPRNKVYRR